MDYYDNNRERNQSASMRSGMAGHFVCLYLSLISGMASLSHSEVVASSYAQQLSENETQNSTLQSLSNSVFVASTTTN